MQLSIPLINGWNLELKGKHVKILDNKNRFIDLGTINGYHQGNLRLLSVVGKVNNNCNSYVISLDNNSLNIELV